MDCRRPSRITPHPPAGQPIAQRRDCGRGDRASQLRLPWARPIAVHDERQDDDGTISSVDRRLASPQIGRAVMQERAAPGA
jgi:hypothetical protein